MNDVAREISVCRSCCRQATLVHLFSLGELYISAFVDREEGEKYPLELVLCDTEWGGCGLVQLRHTVSSEILYRNYWYRSGTNQTMTEELFGIARQSRGLVDLKEGDIVLDIGCNDSTLLSAYNDLNVRRVGFEPARNLIPVAELNADKVIPDFFSFEAWDKEFSGQKAKIITAIAMFYDLDDPNKFVSDVVKCLADDGIFIIQMSYLPLMLLQNAFDNICHEHLEYYSLLSLERLLNRHSLQVIDVETNDTNGGSFRVFIKHKGVASERVERMRQEERGMTLKIYQDFVDRVEKLKKETTDFIKQETARGKKVFVYGASTKGNTLLQYYGLDSSLIPYAAERSQYKWGKKTVGSLIPIISEELARFMKPDYFLILPWHFLEEFVEREKGFLKGGGKFIVPLPKLKVI